MSEVRLIPIQQKTALFYDDAITAVVVQSGDERVVYVPLRPICDYLDWSAQTRRINRDAVLSDEVVKRLVSGVDERSSAVLGAPP